MVDQSTHELLHLDLLPPVAYLEQFGFVDDLDRHLLPVALLACQEHTAIASFAQQFYEVKVCLGKLLPRLLFPFFEKRVAEVSVLLHLQVQL